MLSATDFPCPTCRAQQGQPCLSRGAAGKKAGEPTSKPHRTRLALVPKDKRPPKCGTRAAYKRHKRAGETPCDSCLEANADYMHEYRREHPADYAHEKRMNAARHRALWRLAAAYPEDFRRYVKEEAS